MERKRCLDMHTNIATCLANVITQRQLHVFAEEEDKLITKQNTTVNICVCVHVYFWSTA